MSNKNAKEKNHIGIRKTRIIELSFSNNSKNEHWSPTAKHAEKNRTHQSI